MKLAYVSIFDPTDVHAWSGLGVYMLDALRDARFQLETIGNLSYHPDTLYKVKEVIYTRLLSRSYRMLWDPRLLKNFAAQVDEGLTSLDANVVFSVWTNPVAYTRTDKPIVVWGDATLAGLISLYPNYRRLPAETVRDGHRAEQLALSKCRLAIYSSQWAAETAIQHYDVDPAKVKVVPFGANLDGNRDLDDVRANLAGKRHDVCRLLFIGVDWARKGGDVAVAVAADLNRRGIPAELHIAGSAPPGELPGFVKQHGFVSKKTEAGRRLLDDLFARSHFFIMPTLADCTPIVFPEASSYGLPVLTTNVGGIPTIIHEGLNGFMFSPDDPPAAYGDVIERLWSSRAEYEQLALSSFAEYAERLNWAVAGRQVRDLIEEYCR